MSLPPAHAALLRAFTDDTRRGLGQASSAFGAQVAEHIARQLDLAASPAYTDWFRVGGGEAAGFDQDVTLAAIAGTDVTRPSQGCPVAQAKFGLTSDRVQALAAEGRLRYGRAFAEFGPLEDLYMHAEGGRAYTSEALLRQGHGIAGSDRLATRVSEAIVGHDSFNSGFGAHKLKPLLARRHGGMATEYDYPRSNSLDGFLVQVLDRLEGVEAETMIRYVTEGVSDRGESITEAIKVGIVDNSDFLSEASEQLRRDAAGVAAPSAFATLLCFPGLQSFEAHREILSGVVGRMQPPSGRFNTYRLQLDGGYVALDSVQAIRTCLPVAMRSA